MAITLDFRFMEPASCQLGEDQSKWVEEIEQGAFFGPQIFKAGDADFSGDYPILGFARWLNIIAYHLKLSGKGGFHMDPYFVKKSRTEFSLHGDYVVIAEVARATNKATYTARVPLEEFVSSTAAYKERIFGHCCRLFPRLRKDKQIRAWLDDYPVPEPCNPSDSESSKPAKTVRIGWDDE